jgi:hypothetical protein
LEEKTVYYTHICIFTFKTTEKGRADISDACHITKIWIDKEVGKRKSGVQITYHETESCDIDHGCGYGGAGEGELSEMPYEDNGDNLEGKLRDIDENQGASEMKLMFHFTPTLNQFIGFTAA